MGNIVYEIITADFNQLKTQYGFDVGFLSEDETIYELPKSFLDKWKDAGLLDGLNDFCANTIGKPFEQVFVDNEIRNYICNNEKEVDFKSDYSNYHVFNLTPKNAILDTNGDVIELQYYNPSDELAITEYRTYTREVTGVVPDDVHTMKRTDTIRFHKKDSSYTDIVLPEKTMNDYDRKKWDKKARANVIDTVREGAGDFITSYVISQVGLGNISAQDAPTVIYDTAQEALTMLEALNDQLSAYRDDRQNTPLINALNAYTRTTLLVDEIINYMRDGINITYYTSV